MITQNRSNRKLLLLAAWYTILVTAAGHAQTSSAERTFPQSKATVEKALQALQSKMAGHLPTMEGFVNAGEHSLDHYRRGYYQQTVKVTPAAGGAALVRVTTKVTAWYNDPVASASGYQVLTSNGRLEADLLDELAEQLGKSAAANSVSAEKPAAAKESPEPAVSKEDNSKPPPNFHDAERTFSSSLSQSLAAQERANVVRPEQPAAGKTNKELQAEAENLEEILKNQGHPKNLVAVKKSGTPVVATPSLNAKPLFLASMHDEFEMLDFNADWVHVRVSGLSRGWIWRNSLEMPEGIPDTETHVQASKLAPAADLFRVVREETAQFPGDWEPLRGKNVKILSVQRLDENAKSGGAKERLAYVKALLEKSYLEMTKKASDLAGVVVIFDSSDGGMIAATVPTIEQWKAGTLSDSALWHKCFFDPPETFDAAPTGASQ